MPILTEIRVECPIYGIQVAPHIKPTECGSITLIDSHNIGGNPHLPQILQQAVLVAGEKPSFPFFHEKARTVYEIPFRSEIEKIVVCEGRYTHPEGRNVDILVMLIYHSGSDAPLQHILCELF